MLLKASHGSIILEVGTGGDIVLTDQAVNKEDPRLHSTPLLKGHVRRLYQKCLPSRLGAPQVVPRAVPGTIGFDQGNVAVNLSVSYKGLRYESSSI